MKKMKAFSALYLALFTLVASAASNKEGKISKINLLPSKDSAVLILNYQGSGAFNVVHAGTKPTIVVEVSNLEIPANLTRSINVASSGGPVIEAIPYSANGKNKHAAKIVLQLKEDVLINKTEGDGRFILEMKRKNASLNTAETNIDLPTKPILNSKNSYKKGAWVESDEVKNHTAAPEKSEELAKKLVEVLNSPPENKRYFGSNVTVESSDMSVLDVFRLVGEASGLNIVTDSDVNAKLNFSLKDVPWDQLLDIAMQQADLKASVTGSVVRVYSATKFNKEQEAKRKEIAAASDLEPTIMAVIPISFAKAGDAKTMLDELLTQDSESYKRRTEFINTLPTEARAGMERIDQALVRGKIRVDDRTNSLIVTNTKPTIERIKKLIAELDIPIPQVLIDSKIIIASEKFSKSVGMKWGTKVVTGGQGLAGVVGSYNNGQVTLSNSNAAAYSVTGTDKSAQFGFQLGAGPRANINAAIDLSEINGTAKTIASPRVIVNNRTAASISDGQSVQLITPGTNNGPATSQLISAKLQLDVTPQVTNAGSVLLTVNLTKDQPEGSGSGLTINTKSIKSEVLVDSGSTLVLGGVYQLVKTNDSNGIPLLKDLPFLGQLFRTDSEGLTKSELMVFITPQILYPKTNSSTQDAISSGESNSPSML